MATTPIAIIHIVQSGRIYAPSIPRHCGINLFAANGDAVAPRFAVFDAHELFESLLPQEVQRLQ